MTDKAKNGSALLLASLALSILSVSASVLNKPLDSLLILPAAAAAMLLYRKTERGKSASAEVTQFISNISENSKYHKSAIAVLKRSLDPKFAFYSGFSQAINAYRYSGSAAGMYSVAIKHNAEGFLEAVRIISDSLESGSDMHLPMAELKRKIEETGKRRFSTAKMQGLSSIVRVGAIVFFPMFAGISMEITHITSVLGSSAGLNVLLFSTILMFYIASVNNSIAKNESRDSALRAAAFSSVQIAAALLFFRLSSVVGSMLLRW